MNTRLNLTALADFDSNQQALGRPPEMPLEDILPDPDNAREPFDERSPEDQQKQLDLDEDVAERNVKSPISLRPHPTIPGKWVINFGHSRFEAQRKAGRPTIPYFVDEKFDSYDQVNENELRCPLSPWALAQFVARKLKEGRSKGEIAARLHKKNQNVITELLALVDAPGCLHQAYLNGVKSPRTLYDLRRAWDEHPDQVEAWVHSNAGITRITREAIKDLIEQLRHDVKTVPANDPAPVATSMPPAIEGDGNQAPPAAQAVAPSAAQPAAQELRHDVIPPASAPPSSAPMRELRHDVKVPREPAKSEAPLASPKPPARTREIIAQYKGKPARIAASTTVRISLDGLDAEIEVPLAELVFKP